MKTIVFNIPDTLELDKTEASMLFASVLYEKGKLSLGQAAEMVGLTKKSFMELLGKFGVSIFNHPVLDIENDLRNAESYNI